MLKTPVLVQSPKLTWPISIIMCLKCVNILTVSYFQMEASNYREHIALQEYNWAMAFTSIGAEINTLSGCGTCYFWIHGEIYHSVSLLYPNEANMPGYGHLSYSWFCWNNKETAWKQSNQGCMAKVMQGFDEILWKVNLFAESYKPMHQVKWNVGLIK
jgi:hypothetical protein